MQWVQLSSLPETEGYAGGYAGVVGGALVFAGGTNFAGRPPWEGGTKVWSDNIYLLESPCVSWRMVGKLARPLGYGASVSVKEGLVFIGGNDAERHYRDVVLLRREATGLFKMERLPDLPIPSAFCAAVVSERKIYVVSGTQAPDAEFADKRFWVMDLDDQRSGWQDLTAWPGPGRVMAVTAIFRDEIFLMSGRVVDPAIPREESYLTDAYAYSIGEGVWRTLPALPFPASAVPSPAPVTDLGEVLILGGNDGTLADVFPISGRPDFPQELFILNTKSDDWSKADSLPFAQNVTPTVFWQGRWIVPSGELQPGIRTPTVWATK